MSVKDPQKYIAHFQAHDRLGSLLGFRLLSINETECLGEYEVTADHFNPGGILHGGALFAAMDSCQGAFLHYILDESFKAAVTGTATVKYLAPIKQGKIKIRSYLRDVQGRKHYVDSTATNESGQDVALLEEVWIALPK